MDETYYILNDLIKSYHIFSKFDAAKASDILLKINTYRKQIALLADKRQIFWDQVPVAANATGYKNDVFFSRDDMDSTLIRMLFNLQDTTNITLTQQGTRQQLFTRQNVRWQQIGAAVQSALNGCKIPFDFPQEILLEKNQTLDIGVTNQTAAGNVFVHGANLRDTSAAEQNSLQLEIDGKVNPITGEPVLPQFQILPIQFKFTANTLDSPAVAVDGGSNIFSIKSSDSMILTGVTTTARNCRFTLIDRGRNQQICEKIETVGVSGFFTDPEITYYPLPYPHLLRAQDRFQFEALNGSLITGVRDAANTIQTFAFHGYTV